MPVSCPDRWRVRDCLPALCASSRRRSGLVGLGQQIPAVQLAAHWPPRASVTRLSVTVIGSGTGDSASFDDQPGRNTSLAWLTMIEHAFSAALTIETRDPAGLSNYEIPLAAITT